MLEGPLVFVDVDTQRDFMEPTGALYVDGAEAIVPNLRRLTEHARSHRIPVLATACAHAYGDPELEQFPPHCMAGTPGQKRIAATDWPGSSILAAGDRLDGPVPAHLTLEKQQYSLFSRPDASALLARYEAARPTFVVYGVATDYCVRAAALGLLDRGDPVVIVVDAIRAIDGAREAEFLSELVGRGATLAATDVVCGP